MPMSKGSAQALPFSLLFLALIAASILYWPGLDGGFVFDDYPNIIQESRLKIDQLSLASVYAASLGGDAGPLGRPVSLATIVLNLHFFGDGPYSFKLTNLLLHLLTSAALAWLGVLSARLAGSGRAASLWIGVGAASLWALNAFHVSTVFYVIQRMTILSSLFMILGAISYIYARQASIQRQFSKTVLYLVSLLCFFVLGVFSKETAVSLVIYLAVLEVVFLRSVGPVFVQRTLRVLLWSGALLGVAVLGIAVSGEDPFGWFGSYAWRGFSMTERLLTEPRIVWKYAFLFLFPSPSELGLFWDYVPVSNSLSSPVTTAPAMIGLVAVSAAALALVSRKEISCRIGGFAIFWFLAGHLLESSIFPIELAWEHRNYLPSFGLSLILAAAAVALFKRHVGATVSGIGIYVLFLAGTLYMRADQWGDTFDHAMAEKMNHPNSARANFYLGSVLTSYSFTDPSTKMHKSATYFSRAWELNNSFVSALITQIPLYYSLDRDLPAGLIDDIFHSLEHAPIQADTVTALVMIGACQSRGDCRLKNDTVVSMYKVFLDRSMPSSYRDIVELAYAQFLGDQLQDYQTALEVLEQGAPVNESTQKFQFFLLQAKYLLLSGHESQSKEYLDLAIVEASSAADEQLVSDMKQMIGDKELRK